jgi:ABC-type glycerol-3-phosphate transport system substrate-binding protein
LFQEGQVDVFTFSTDGSLFTDRMAVDGILNLTPLIQQNDAPDLDDYYASALDPFAIEGSVWALPVSINVGVIYYNKDLFDQYGVAYPEMGWTWDDMLDAALRVRDPDKDVYGLVAFPHFSIPFVYQHGGRLVDDWRMPTRMTLDEPRTIEAVEWFAGLIHDWDVMPSPEATTKLFGQQGNAAYIYWRRQSGMYVGWLSDRGGETWGPQGKWRMRWGMLPLPRDERPATLGIVHAYAISADTEHPDACWEWLMFLNNQIPPYTMPARRSLAESDAYRQRVGEEEASVALASIYHTLIIAESQVDSDLEVQMQRLFEVLVEILNGDVSALGGLSDLQRQTGSG